MKRLICQPSPIHRLGLFIGEDIEKGELICHIKGTVMRKTNLNRRDALANPNWIGIAKNKWFNPEKPYEYINHSYVPSAGIRGKISLIALRSMKKGEEITIDYSTVEGDPFWKMACACRTRQCRQIIKSIQFLPERKYRRLDPHIPAYFKNLYIRNNAGVRD
jgi:SET domain-containing protein